MSEADASMQAYEKLLAQMPSIGFFSRKKRILAFLKVTAMAQEMIDEGEITVDHALFILSILSRKNPAFQKAAMMTALNLPKMQKRVLKPIGLQYANEFRCNLQLLPVDVDEEEG